MKHLNIPFIVISLCLIGAQGFSQTPGWSNIRMGDEEIELFRDNYGVPHIYAKSFKGIYFGQGYVAAQDRLTQLEMYRRDARGTLAEIRGEGELQHDQQMRRRGYSTAERWRIFASVDEETRTAFIGLRDGINHYINEAIEGNKLPQMFEKLGIKPEPWSVIDSIAIAEMMTWRFGSGGSEELRLKSTLDKLIEKYGEKEGMQVFDDLIALDDRDAPTTAPKAKSEKKKGGKKKAWNPDENDTVASVRIDGEVLKQTVRDWDALLDHAKREGLFHTWGSNAWVVAPERSASGNAMLFGGPMMGFRTPQIAHEVHLNGPAYLDGRGTMNVIGMDFVGLPTVLIGHNQRMAWTTTSGGGDISDTYIEVLNPDNHHQYKFNGEWLDMERRAETIRVRQSDGSFKEVEEPIYRTIHGVVTGWDEKNHRAITVKHAWWGNYDYSMLKAFLEFNRAEDVKDFERGCRLIQSTHHFFYADQKGNIAYYWVGRYPIHAEGTDPRLPSMGTGEQEWRGVVPWKKHPQSVNPKQGYFGNWNNKPGDKWKSLYNRVFWGHRILERLKNDDAITLEEMEHIAVETGRNDFMSDYLESYLLEGAQHPRAASDARVAQAVEIIKNYSHVRGDGSPAEAIYDVFAETLLREVFADELDFLFSERLDNDTVLVLTGLMLRAFEPETSYLKPSRDYLNGKSRAEVLAQALIKTLDTLEEQQGKEVGKWRAQERWIDFGEAGRIPWARRGTYMQVVELSKPKINGRNVLPPGESEDPESPHYKDQLEMYANWQYKPMRYLREDLKGKP
jgi:penicillin amidase